MLGNGPISDTAIADGTTSRFVSSTALVDYIRGALRGQPARYLVRTQSKDIGAPGQVHNLNYADGVYIAPRSGTLADTYFDGRVCQPLNLSVSIPTTPESDRAASIQSADIEIENEDGALDTLVETTTLNGRDIQVLAGLKANPYDWFVPVASLSVVSWTNGYSKVKITARDRGYILDVSLQTNLYDGSGGINGEATNAGKPRPLCFGGCNNVSPVLIDSTNLIYQVHYRAISSVTKVRDKGALLTIAGDYANYAALVAAALTPGQCATCLALGLVRLKSQPAGTVTMDLSGEGSITTDIVKRLLTDLAGVSLAQIDTASLAALAEDDGFIDVYSAGIGWYQGSEVITVRAALDRLIGHFGGWWGTDKVGRFTFGALVKQAAADPATFTVIVDADIDAIELIDPPNGTESPRWRQNYSSQNNWTIQAPADLAGSVSAADVALYGQPSQQGSQANVATRATFQNAVDSPVLQTLFVGQLAADTLAASLLAFYGTAKEALRVVLTYFGAQFVLGQGVKLTTPRVNGGATKNYVLIGMEIDAQSNTFSLILWG